MAFLWLINGGDPNYLLIGMILQVGHPISHKIHGVGIYLPCRFTFVDPEMLSLHRGLEFLLRSFCSSSFRSQVVLDLVGRYSDNTCIYIYPFFMVRA